MPVPAVTVATVVRTSPVVFLDFALNVTVVPEIVYESQESFAKATLNTVLLDVNVTFASASLAPSNVTGFGLTVNVAGSSG